MKLISAPDRCNARARRLGQVKFVALPQSALPAETDRAWIARLASSLRDSAIRVIGCLEAARP
ncbi:MAG: hypothetical protein ACXWG9_03685 [Usitatibacter sp.]